MGGESKNIELQNAIKHKLLLIYNMITTKQKPIVETQKIQKKQSKHPTKNVIESQGRAKEESNRIIAKHP